jgi:hypothetical protein
MKNGVVVCAAALLLAALVPRLAAAAVKLDLGLKAGRSTAKIRQAFDTPYYEVAYSGKPTRFVFGAFVTFSLNELFAIQPEIYLLTQGGKWPDNGLMLAETLLLSYIHVPVLAKVRPIHAGKFIPFFLAGPSPPKAGPR